MEDSMNSGIPATMLVGPTGYAGNGGGFGNGFGGDGWWILLLILLCGGGWGMGGFGGGAMPFMMGMDGGFGLYPWMTTNQNVNNGFRDQMIHDAITSVGDKVSSGFGDVALGIAGINQNLCQTGNGIVSAVTAAQTGISQQLYSNELASLNRSFAEQTANTAGFTGVNSGLADLKYTVASEACADRAALSQGIQTVLDKLCALELDGYKRENDQLRTQLNMANLAASQTAQTAELRQSGATQLNQLVSELRSCPIPAQPVYGNQPIFQCSGPAWNTNGGCGCNGSFAN